MGGEREQNIETEHKAADGIVAIGSLRVHQSKSDIHFHDDTRSLKVAVPAAVWMAAYQRLHSQLPNARWQYIDTKRGTLLTVALDVGPSGQDLQPAADIRVTISPVHMSPILTKLNTLTYG